MKNRIYKTALTVFFMSSTAMQIQAMSNINAAATAVTGQVSAVTSFVKDQANVVTDAAKCSVNAITNTVWYQDGVFSLNVKPVLRFVKGNLALTALGATLGILYYHMWCDAQATHKKILLDSLETMLKVHRTNNPENTVRLYELASKCYALPYVYRGWTNQQMSHKRLQRYLAHFIEEYERVRQANPILPGEPAYTIYEEIKKFLLGGSPLS